jgi:signal transduction histidine kinase
MIGDLLDVSRIQAPRLELQRQITDVGGLVCDVVSRMATLVSDHPIRLETAEAIPASCVDPARIERVLSDLLSNAAKYSYPDNEILVNVARRYAVVEVSLTNEGVGVPPDELPKLFSRYYRTEVSRNGKAGGLGLGLYISKDLVEGHGGRIWVESVPGKKTTFCFTIPIMESCP